MKNGIFKITYLSLCILTLTLQGCASLLDFGLEQEEPSDRGLAQVATEDDDEKCVGRYCDQDDYDATKAPADEEDLVAKTKFEQKQRLKRAIYSRDIILGMTRQQVLESWGSPSMRETAGENGVGHERWTYGSRYSLSGERTVIFEEGKVAGWGR